MTGEEIIGQIREEVSKVERELAIIEDRSPRVGIGRVDPAATKRRLDHLYGLITELRRLLTQYEAPNY